MLTTQSQIRAAFWRDLDIMGAPVSRKKIRDYAGTGKMHNTDTRCAFVDYVDMLARSGEITEELAERVTL